MKLPKQPIALRQYAENYRKLGKFAWNMGCDVSSLFENGRNSAEIDSQNNLEEKIFQTLYR